MLADEGCRNSIFNAAAQSALPYLPGLLAAGVGTLRVELVDEPPEHVAPLLEGYWEAVQDARRGRRRPRPAADPLWRFLVALPDANGRAHGVGRGSLEPRAERSTAGMKPTAASLR